MRSRKRGQPRKKTPPKSEFKEKFKFPFFQKLRSKGFYSEFEHIPLTGRIYIISIKPKYLTATDSRTKYQHKTYPFQENTSKFLIGDVKSQKAYVNQKDDVIKLPHSCGKRRNFSLIAFLEGGIAFSHLDIKLGYYGDISG